MSLCFYQSETADLYKHKPHVLNLFDAVVQLKSSPLPNLRRVDRLSLWLCYLPRQLHMPRLCQAKLTTSIFVDDCGGGFWTYNNRPQCTKDTPNKYIYNTHRCLFPFCMLIRRPEWKQTDAKSQNDIHYISTTSSCSSGDITTLTSSDFSESQ